MTNQRVISWLLNLREDDPKLSHWMKINSNKFTSVQIQKYINTKNDGIKSVKRYSMLFTIIPLTAQTKSKEL